MEYDIDLFEPTPADDMSEIMPRHSLRNDLILDKVRAFYDNVGVEHPEYLDPADFDLDPNDHLFFKKSDGTKVQLTNRRNPRKFLAKSTLRNRMPISDQARLNLASEQDMRYRAISNLQNTLTKLPTGIESVPLKELQQVSNNISDHMETSFNEETVLKTINDSPFPMRELRALDHALKSIKGELANNLAKLGELDEHIEREKLKMTEADDKNFEKDIKDRISKRLSDLMQERSARLEVLSTNREQLRTQVNRLRETIERILYEDTTLVERIRTLFREQGITISSIITALGFAISTIVLAVTGGPSPSPGPPAPASPNKSWIKKQLDHLSSLLKKLAEKSLIALPGILGSILSWLFSTAGKVVGFMASNLWSLGLLIIGLLLTKIKTY